MIYLTNAFSIHMLPKMNCGEWENIRFKRISSDEACRMLKGQNFKSFFGHVETVKHLESRWRMHIHISREQVQFRKGDTMVIATVASKRTWESEGVDVPGFRFFLVEYQ